MVTATCLHTVLWYWHDATEQCCRCRPLCGTTGHVIGQSQSFREWCGWFCPGRCQLRLRCNQI